MRSYWIGLMAKVIEDKLKEMGVLLYDELPSIVGKCPPQDIQDALRLLASQGKIEEDGIETITYLVKE